MNSSAVIPEGDVTVFFSPNEESPKTNTFFPIDSSDKSPKTEKFQTSVSVSSLAEKFERSGDFGSVIENNSEIPKSNDASSQMCSELPGDIKSSLKNEKMVGPPIFDFSNKDCVTDPTECMENGANGELQPFNASTDILKAAQEFEKNTSCVYCVGLQSSNFTTDIPTAVQEVNNKNISCVYCSSLQSAIAATDNATAVQKAKIMNGSSVQSSTSTAGATVEKDVQSSSQDSLEFITEAEITKAVEERVAYFVEKIAQNSVTDATSKNVQKSVPGEANENSSNEIAAKISTIVGSISLKDLEESFIAALKLANCREKEVAEKNTETLPVPSIKITEASDREDSSSDDAEETKSKCEVNATEVKTSAVTEMEVSDTEQSTNEKQTPSTSIASQYEKEDGTEISPEERRHSDLQDRNRIFYISSSDLPARDLASLQNSGEFRQPTVSVERMEYLGTNPILVDNSENVSVKIFYF